MTLVVGGGLLGGCVAFARRGDDARSFTCAVAATLALSPIVWLHYLVVLLVPIAIARPRFSALWLLPVLLWASPRPGYAEGFQTFLPAIAVVILVTVLLARPAQRSRGHRGRRGRVSVTEHAALGNRRLLSTALLVAFAGALLVPLIVAAGSDRLAFDFNSAYLPAAEAVRAGGSPYSTRFGDLPYVYPPLLAELLVPLTLRPYGCRIVPRLPRVGCSCVRRARARRHA